MLRVENSDDLVAVAKSDSHDKIKWGFVDKTGKEIIPCIYELPFFASGSEYLCTISEGLIRVGKNNKFGYIDKTGKEVVPFIYDIVEDFSEGMGLVKNITDREGWRYGFVDKTGKEVIPCVYENASPFSEGLACVQKNGKYGFIDKNGKEVIPFNYNMTSEGDDVNSTTEFNNGFAVLRINDGEGSAYDYEADGKCGAIDKSGKVIIPFQYSEIRFVGNNLFACSIYNSKNNTQKWGILDKTGKEVIPFIYDVLTTTEDNYLIVTRNGKYGVLNNNGKEVISCQYDGVDMSWEKPLVRDGLIKVEKGKKYGFVDKTGKEIIPCVLGGFSVFSGSLSDTYFSDIYFSNELALVKWNNQEGYVDKDGYFIGRGIVKIIVSK
jgi:hypothetical protein